MDRVLTVPTAVLQRISASKRGSSKLIFTSQEAALLESVKYYTTEALVKAKPIMKRRGPVPIWIRLNGRFTTTAGKAQVYLDMSKGRREYYYTLDISKKVFANGKDSQFLIDTVYHEVAHILEWEVHRALGHGPNWQRIMRLLDKEPYVYCYAEDFASVGYPIDNMEWAKKPEHAFMESVCHADRRSLTKRELGL